METKTTRFLQVIYEAPLNSRQFFVYITPLNFSSGSKLMSAVPARTIIAVQVIIGAALIALPVASTNKVAFAVRYTKNISNTTTHNLCLTSHI